MSLIVLISFPIFSPQPPLFNRVQSAIFHIIFWNCGYLLTDNSYKNENGNFPKKKQTKKTPDEWKTVADKHCLLRMGWEEDWKWEVYGSNFNYWVHPFDSIHTTGLCWVGLKVSSRWIGMDKISSSAVPLSPEELLESATFTGMGWVSVSAIRDIRTGMNEQDERCSYEQRECQSRGLLGLEVPVNASECLKIRIQRLKQTKEILFDTCISRMCYIQKVGFSLCLHHK